jgi:hypothetical protein
LSHWCWWWRRQRTAVAERALREAGARHQARRQRRDAQLTGLIAALEQVQRRHAELASERADCLPALAAAVANLRRAVTGAERHSLERALFT